LYMLPLLVILSIVSFGILQAQPGDFLTQYRFNPRISQETLNQVAHNLGLDRPLYVQYWYWLKGIITRGDFGYSFERHMPVTRIFAQWLPFTFLVTIPTLVFAWIVAIPLGIYSATHQYKISDHFFTFFGFLGLSIPNFFLALILLYILAVPLGAGSVGGLFTQENMSGSPWPWFWSWAKFKDYLVHLWPVIVAIGTSAVAGLMRQMRGNLLDILGEQYVQTARAKGLRERVVIYKHAVRNAINPLVSIFGLSLPYLIEGTLLSAIVLNLPTVERVYFQALLRQDTYVVMTLLMFFSFALLFGNLLADIMLAVVNPKIRYD
ncbi:MAG: ABC transporter permease, partial [Candidatus Bipolaricaulia bacterium]